MFAFVILPDDCWLMFASSWSVVALLFYFLPSLFANLHPFQGSPNGTSQSSNSQIHENLVDHIFFITGCPFSLRLICIISPIISSLYQIISREILHFAIYPWFWKTPPWFFCPPGGGWPDASALPASWCRCRWGAMTWKGQVAMDQNIWSILINSNEIYIYIYVCMYVCMYVKNLVYDGNIMGI